MRLIVIFLLISTSLHAQKNASTPACNQSYFHFVISTLANDSMEGRLPGTIAEKKSAAFIETQLLTAGTKPLRNKKTQFPFHYKNEDSIPVSSIGNVVTTIDTKSKFCIVISAHYDHIGHGGLHSLDPFSKAVHNGADDNASGVAMMLGLASWCKENQKKLNYDMVFIAFSGEEDGLFGSQYFLSQNLIDTSTIICNINYDMVGHLDKIRPMLEIEGAIETNAWKEVLPSDTTKNFIAERSRILVKGGADNYTFYKASIPAILISTGLTAHYHKTTDDLETINFEGMDAIANYSKELILNLNRKKELEQFLK
jgi:putative aminopeptidase FrvX